MGSKQREDELHVIFQACDPVESWRYRGFRRLGFDREIAALLALDRSVDLHRAEDLLAAGCSLETAQGILL